MYLADGGVDPLEVDLVAVEVDPCIHLEVYSLLPELPNGVLQNDLTNLANNHSVLSN